MIAMRLKRYPSPSGGIALGKMGVGAKMMKPILPAGARWVKYLESTGTQWIDTGVLTSQGIRLVGVLDNTGETIPSYLCGVRSGNATITIGGGTTSYGYIRWGISAYASAMPYGRAAFDVSSSGCIVNNVPYSYSETQTVTPSTGLTITIFAGRINTYSVTAYAHMKLFGMQIFDNNALVRDFRPIAIGTTGYMLDLVSGEYLQYGNKGTGDFVIGPDINAPAI